MHYMQYKATVDAILTKPESVLRTALHELYHMKIDGPHAGGKLKRRIFELLHRDPFAPEASNSSNHLPSVAPVTLTPVVAQRARELEEIPLPLPDEQKKSQKRKISLEALSSDGILPRGRSISCIRCGKRINETRAAQPGKYDNAGTIQVSACQRGNALQVCSILMLSRLHEN